MPNQEVFLSDNSGNRVPPHPTMADPVAASGATTNTASAGDDLTLTVVAGATYIITCIATSGFFSITFDRVVASVYFNYAKVNIDLPLL